MQRLIWIALSAMLATFPALGQDSRGDLPDIGNPASTTLSLEDEYKIGRMIVKGLRDSGQLVEDPEVAEYIQSVGSSLASHAHEGSYRFTFFVVKDSDINAPIHGSIFSSSVPGRKPMSSPTGTVTRVMMISE